MGLRSVLLQQTSSGWAFFYFLVSVCGALISALCLHAGEAGEACGAANCGRRHAAGFTVGSRVVSEETS